MLPIYDWAIRVLEELFSEQSIGLPSRFFLIKSFPLVRCNSASFLQWGAFKQSTRQNWLSRSSMQARTRPTKATLVFSLIYPPSDQSAYLPRHFLNVRLVERPWRTSAVTENSQSLTPFRLTFSTLFSSSSSRACNSLDSRTETGMFVFFFFLFSWESLEIQYCEQTRREKPF